MTPWSQDELSTVRADHVFDGGDLDCGSGLALLIRQHMMEVPGQGVLEIRSREGTVRDDLPPWCRMTGHEYLGALEGDDAEHVRYFVRKGSGAQAPTEDTALAADLEAARHYEWRVRARSTGPMRSKVYFRNFTVEVGAPASFEERDEQASAVEYLLAALGGSLCTAFASECRRSGLVIDDIETTVTGTLGNVLAQLGLPGEGDPGFARIVVRCFASTLDDEAAVRECWERTVRTSPIAATLNKACELELKLSLV